MSQSLPDYFQNDAPGVLSLGGARVAMLDIEAGFWGLRRQLEALVGPRLADLVIQQAGANGGASFARSFTGEAGDLDHPSQALRDCIAAYQAAGFGHFEVRQVEWPIGRVEVQARDSFEAWMMARHNQSPGSPVCAYTAGVLVGFVNVIAGRSDVVCLERACQAAGAEACLFELLPAAQAEGQPVVGLDPDPALGRSISLLDILFDRMPMGIAILDTEFNLRRFNPTWAAFIDRYAPAGAGRAMPGMNLFDLEPGTELTLLPLLERVLNGEIVRRDAIRLEMDGVVSYWDIVLTPVVEEGQVTGILNVSLDATGRMKTFQQLEQITATLQEREERLNLVMQATNDGIWDWDVQTGNVYYSPRWKNMLGYHEDEIDNRFITWRKLVHPDDLAQSLVKIEDMLAGRSTSYELEHRLLHKDGNYRWILSRGVMVRDEHSEPVRMVGSHSDITDRKQALEALEANRADLKSLLENGTNFAIYRVRVDPESPTGGQVVMVSPSITKIAGVQEPDNFESWFRNLHPEDEDRMLAANRRAWDNGEPFDEISRVYVPERRRWVWIHTLSTPVFNQDGDLTHFNGLVVDISEQKEAEAALQESQRALATLMSNLPGMAYRSKNALDGTMEFASEGSLELLGCSPGELMGKISYTELIHPDYRQEVWDEIQQAVLAGRPYRLTYRIVTAGGIEKWVWEQGRGVPDSTGEVIALEGFVTDISGRVTAQQLLETRVAERTHQLSTLVQVSSTINSTLDLVALLPMVLDQLQAVVAYHGASVLALEEGFFKVISYKGPIPPAEALALRFSIQEAGVNRKVIETRKGIIIDDVRGESDLATAFRVTAGSNLDSLFADLRSWMGVPLLYKDRVLGMLGLDHHEPGYYHDSHMALAQAFADQVAVSMENARLYAVARQRADEAQTLFAVQQAITSRLKGADVLKMIANEARRLTDTTQGAVYLLDGDEFVVSVISGQVGEEMVGFRVPVEGSAAGLVIKTGKPILSTDAQNDPRVYPDIAQRLDVKSYVVVPLMSSTGPIGTITVANKRSGTLGPEDERTLTLLASSAVVALENANLYRAEQERRRVAESLRDILNVLNSNKPLETILNFIVSQANQLLDSQACVLYQLNPREGLIEILASYGLPPEMQAIHVLPSRAARLLGHGQLDHDLLSGQPYAVPDAHELPPAHVTEEGYLGRELVTWQQSSGNYYRAFLSVPLTVNEELYGSLGFHYEQPRLFTDEEIRLAVTFGDQTSLAIENARLRAQVAESAILTERSRLARDLHDAVTQTLFSASLIAEVLPRLFERNPQEGARRLDELRQLTRGALAEMRTLLMELRPTALMEAEPGELFRHLAEAFTGRSRLPVELKVESRAPFPPEIKIAFYRIAQEALNNVAKHADASRVSLRMICASDRVLMVVEDDGKGFSFDQVGGDHLGLGIMRERAESIGANLKINTARKEGTRVTVVWRP
jgi:PAS domain S-box-containing protein